LTAATVLQRAGLRTLCLEANTYCGGMAATVELIDGFRYEIAGSVQFPTASVVAEELGLNTLPTVQADVMSVNIGDAGEEPMVFYRDPMVLMTHLGEKHGAEAVMGMAQLIQESPNAPPSTKCCSAPRWMSSTGACPTRSSPFSPSTRPSPRPSWCPTSHPTSRSQASSAPNIYPADLVSRVTARDHRSPYVQIHFALYGLPQFAPPYEILNQPGMQQSIGIFGSPEEQQRQWEECRRGVIPDNPSMGLQIPSANDPSLAPPGKHAASAFAYAFPDHPLCAQFQRHSDTAHHLRALPHADDVRRA
jgi:phytoene dehydrogenase-like protein